MKDLTMLLDELKDMSFFNVRTSVKQVGQAIVTIATSRPKKIGGERAKYQ